MSATPFLRPGWKLGVALSAAGLLAAACGGSSSGGNAAVGTSPTATTTQAAANGNSAGVTLTTHKGPLGTYLTTSSGMTLYMFEPDTDGKSHCSASCAQYWPPLAGSAAQTKSAATASLVGTTTRSDGTTQITYAGHPLYTYVGDTKAGQTNGEAKNLNGGEWYVLDPTGKKIDKGSSDSNSTSTGWS
jgi:predicted lipoprotein with Yx(FWY)xxD motif